MMNMNQRPSCHGEREKLRVINFAIQETVLYCGPMTMYGNVSRDSWDWVKGPWPWEPDAN